MNNESDNYLWSEFHNGAVWKAEDGFLNCGSVLVDCDFIVLLFFFYQLLVCCTIFFSFSFLRLQIVTVFMRFCCCCLTQIISTLVRET